MREIPLEKNTKAIDFAHRLITGEIGIAVFLTGVGFQQLLEIVERHVDRDRYLNALVGHYNHRPRSQADGRCDEGRWPHADASSA